MPEEKIETPFHFIQTPFRQHLDFLAEKPAGILPCLFTRMKPQAGKRKKEIRETKKQI